MRDRTLLIFSYDFPPNDGGVARLCAEIADGMKLYYNNVIVLTHKKDKGELLYNYKSIKVVEIDAPRGQLEWQLLKYLRQWENKAQTDILCGLFHPEATIAWLAGFRNVFILGHGTEFLSGHSWFRKNFWLPVYARWILKQSQAVIANSHYTARLIKEVSPKASIKVLPLGVNPNFFRPIASKKNDGNLYLVTVSRILQFKGYDFVANVIACLPEHYRSKIRWTIGGKGDYLEELQQLVRKLGIEQQVDFCGFVPDEDLPMVYSSADVFIMPTREQEGDTSVEGFGLVFLEAQACGTPAIGARTGGIPDAVIPGEGGWLINQDNTEELSALLQSLIDQPESVTAQALAGRKRVENTANWSYYCSQLKNIFNR